MSDITMLLKAAPVVAQARSFSDVAKNVTNISDPVNLYILYEDFNYE